MILSGAVPGSRDPLIKRRSPFRRLSVTAPWRLRGGRASSDGERWKRKTVPAAGGFQMRDAEHVP